MTATARRDAANAAARLYYVYGIVDDRVELRDAPAGIGGASVESVDSSGLRALVSAIDFEEYRPELIEERTGDVEWLAPRAEAHDAVVSWAGEPGPVVPLHMWSLFSDQESIRSMLGERAAELKTVLQRLAGADEYGLRVYADAASLESGAATMDAGLARLERDAKAAAPGQRYLLERKLDTARRDAARRQAIAAADSVFAALLAESVDAARDEISDRGTTGGTAVLSAAFLVRRDRLDAFRSAVTIQVRMLEPQGFRFAFTGPWPPYHFASGQPN